MLTNEGSERGIMHWGRKEGCGGMHLGRELGRGGPPWAWVNHRKPPPRKGKFEDRGRAQNARESERGGGRISNPGEEKNKGGDSRF